MRVGILDGIAVIAIEDIQPLILASGIFVKAVQSDNSNHGGLITRDTIRKSDELRIELAKMERGVA